MHASGSPQAGAGGQSPLPTLRMHVCAHVACTQRHEINFMCTHTGTPTHEDLQLRAHMIPQQAKLAGDHGVLKLQNLMVGVTVCAHRKLISVFAPIQTPIPRLQGRQAEGLKPLQGGIWGLNRYLKEPQDQDLVGKRKRIPTKADPEGFSGTSKQKPPGLQPGGFCLRWLGSGPWE